MKFIQKTALATLLCALAVPAAQAATASLTTNSTPLLLTSIDTGLSTQVNWPGFGTIAALATPFSGLTHNVGSDLSLAGPYSFSTVAGESYELVLNYSFAVSAANAGDAGAAALLSMTVDLGNDEFASEGAANFVQFGQSAAGGSTLSVFFTANSAISTVSIAGQAKAISAVPEAGTTALTLAGMAVVGGVMARRRKAQVQKA